MAELEITRLSEIQSTDVEWLWYPYLPFGKLTIIQGDPGSGKTMPVLYLASLLSTGSPLPTEDKNIKHDPMTVIYQTSEDGHEDTIKPRLEKFDNVDFNNIVFIKEDRCSLTMLDERIEQAIIQENAKLLVLDPIQAYIGQSVDMNRANEMRPLIKNLMTIAQNHQVAIVLVDHMNKGKGSKSSYRNLGSIDIPAAARSVLICGELKNEDGIRAVVQDKSSLAQRGKPFAFKFDDNGFKWIGEYDIDVDELLDGFKKVTDKERAKEFILKMLANTPIKAIEMYEKGKSWYWRLN